MTAGVIAVWSSGAPMLRAIPFPPGKLVIDRSHFPSDRELHSCRIQLTPWLGDRVTIADLDDSAIYVNGLRMPRPTTIEMPVVIRIGQTLLVAVRDTAPYLGRSHVTRHGLDVCASLHEPCNQLDRAILDETNVAIAGPRWVTHQLAGAYLAAHGGGSMVDVARRNVTLDGAIASGRRCVLLESPNALVKTEYRTLRNWLETDIRFVTCMRTRRDLDMIPMEIRRWLAPTSIEIPQPRYDEIPFTIHAAVRYAAPTADIDVRVVEDFMTGLQTWEEDELFALLADHLRIVPKITRIDRMPSPRGLRQERSTFRMASYPIDED